MADFIQSNYKGQQKKRLMLYFNSDLFEIELEQLMIDQRNAGESISKDFAGECLLESQANREQDEYKTTQM